MKAITMWQPWASLLACGAKKFETRSWATNYRGPIAIHAAAKRPPNQSEIPWKNFSAITNALMRHFGAWRFDWRLGATKNYPDGTDNGFDIPLGAVIATAELVGCWEIAEDPNGPFICRPFFGDITDKPDELIVRGNELLFGDYTPGRYAWEFANMTMLPEPIAAKGKQRLWEWEDLNEK